MNAFSSEAPGQYGFEFVPCAELPRYLRRADGLTLETVARSLAQELARAGWAPVTSDPRRRRSFTRGTINIDVDQMLGDLASGAINDAGWQQTCRHSGIARMNVAIPSAAYSRAGWQSAPPPTGAPLPLTPPPGGQPEWSAQTAYDPVFPRGSTRSIAILFAAFVLFAVIAMRSSMIYGLFQNGNDPVQADSGAAASPAKKGKDTQLAADGRSNLPGGSATLRYKTVTDDFEVVHDENAGAGPHDGASWSFEHWDPGVNSRTVMELHHYIYEPQPTTRALIKHYVSEENGSYGLDAGHPVKMARGRIDGHPSYTWEYTGQDRRRKLYADVFDTVHSYQITCVTPAGNATNFMLRCKHAIKTIKFDFRPGGN